MKTKNENGIALITLVIVIVLILAISGMMGYYTINGLQVQEINNLYSDIEQIQNEIDAYYIKNNDIPVLGENISFENSSNPNDDLNEYYVIDLSKLGKLNLNYGLDFETIKQEGTVGDNTNVYIINKQSQTIYNLQGREFEGKIYYTKPINYVKIEE